MSEVRGMCCKIGCGRLQQNKGRNPKTGYQSWGKYCQKHNEEAYNYGSGKYTRHKKNFCERCGVNDVVGASILQVDHKDGNKYNNQISNLQTLCYSCHKLKTSINKDWKNKSSEAVLPGYERN